MRAAANTSRSRSASRTNPGNSSAVDSWANGAVHASAGAATGGRQAQADACAEAGEWAACAHRWRARSGRLRSAGIPDLQRVPAAFHVRPVQRRSWRRSASGDRRSIRWRGVEVPFAVSSVAPGGRSPAASPCAQRRRRLPAAIERHWRRVRRHRGAHPSGRPAPGRWRPQSRRLPPGETADEAGTASSGRGTRRLVLAAHHQTDMDIRADGEGVCCPGGPPARTACAAGPLARRLTKRE